MIGPTNLLAIQLQANAFSFLIESLWSFLFLKMIDFSRNNGLIKFSSNFFLICSTSSLVSAKKDCFFFLLIKHLFSVAVSSLKLLFSGSDTTRFQIFVYLIFASFSRFLILSHYHIIYSSHVTLLAFRIRRN